MLEEPSNALAHRDAAAQVLVAKQGMDLTRPVYGGGEATHLGASLRLTFAALARAVCGYIESRRPGLANPLEDLTGLSRTIED